MAKSKMQIYTETKAYCSRNSKMCLIWAVNVLLHSQLSLSRSVYKQKWKFSTTIQDVCLQTDLLRRTWIRWGLATLTDNARSSNFIQVSRQLFHLSDTPFVDHRLPREQWGDLKSSSLFYKMQIKLLLFFSYALRKGPRSRNGRVLPQSFAIARYLAREFD